jgi:hypothetical protein
MGGGSSVTSTLSGVPGGAGGSSFVSYLCTGPSFNSNAMFDKDVQPGIAVGGAYFGVAGPGQCQIVSP